MYNQEDDRQINAYLRRSWTVTLVITGLLLALYVACMIHRWPVVAMVTGPVMFLLFTFFTVEYIIPGHRYKRFLEGQKNGLSREIDGTLLEIGETEDLQDGVRVLPVRVGLKDEDDERIVYWNAGKRGHFPGVGAQVRLKCQGRHVLEVLPNEPPEAETPSCRS